MLYADTKDDCCEWELLFAINDIYSKLDMFWLWVTSYVLTLYEYLFCHEYFLILFDHCSILRYIILIINSCKPMPNAYVLCICVFMLYEIQWTACLSVWRCSSRKFNSQDENWLYSLYDSGCMSITLRCFVWIVLDWLDVSSSFLRFEIIVRVTSNIFVSISFSFNVLLTVCNGVRSLDRFYIRNALVS